jgi:hypothetical protein
MKDCFHLIAASVFAVVSALHVLRIVFSWDVQIGTSQIPYWVSWAGGFIAAALAVWGFALVGGSKKNRAA